MVKRTSWRSPAKPSTSRTLSDSGGGQGAHWSGDAIVVGLGVAGRRAGVGRRVRFSWAAGLRSAGLGRRLQKAARCWSPTRETVD